MFPVLIEVKPKLSEMISLTQPIKLVFTEDIDISDATYHMVNLNEGTEFLDYTLSSENHIITINLKENCQYEQLTEYKFVINGLRTVSSSPEVMRSPITIKFETNGCEEDGVYHLADDYSSIEYPVIIKTYPAIDGYTNPKQIKLKFNKLPKSIKISLVEGVDTDLDFIEEELIVFKDVTPLTDENKKIAYMDLAQYELKEATKYTVISEHTDNANQTYVNEFAFTTKYEKLYTQVSNVLDSDAFKGFTSNMTEIEIDSYINSNSLYVEKLLEKNENARYDLSISVPAVVNDYVRYKTQYDILFNKIIDISGNATTQTLKDLTVIYGQSIGDLLALADRLKLRYTSLEPEITGSSTKASSAVFVRGSDADEELEFMNRQFADIEGTKSW